MMDFIYELYKNDHFTMYLTIILVILVILFVVVLFFGKKDQKLEETKRLQKIELENNTFKEEKEEPTKLEVSEPKFESIEPKTIEPQVEEPKEIKEIVLKPNVEENIIQNDEPIIKEESDSFNKEEPIFKTENNLFNFEKPVIEDENEDIDLSSLASIQEEFNKIEIPSIDDEIKVEEKQEEKEEKVFKPSQVFSSVYVNNEKSNVVESVNELKDQNDVTNAQLFTIADDEDDEDMELPSLKG